MNATDAKERTRNACQQISDKALADDGIIWMMIRQACDTGFNILRLERSGFKFSDDAWVVIIDKLTSLGYTTYKTHTIVRISWADEDDSE